MGLCQALGHFPNNFNQIHPYLVLNISLKRAKEPQTYDMADCIFLLKMVTKRLFFVVKLTAFSRLEVARTTEDLKNDNA